VREILHLLLRFCLQLQNMIFIFHIYNAYEPIKYLTSCNLEFYILYILKNMSIIYFFINIFYHYKPRYNIYTLKSWKYGISKPLYIVYEILCKFAWKSCIFIGLQGDILVCHPHERVTICLSVFLSWAWLFLPSIFFIMTPNSLQNQNIIKKKFRRVTDYLQTTWQIGTFNIIK
jgi:hypothetical protein